MILVAGIKGFSESWLNIVVLSTMIYNFPEDDEDYHGCVNNAFKIKFKVCHSSAFQTILRRSVYMKIINYSDSISANLKKTIQTKQRAMKKPHSYSNRNKIYMGLFFVVGGFWAETVQNLQFLLIQ